MWSPDDLDFTSNVEATFLLSAWHELFYGFTPDSNQPRLHNIPSLIQELADIGAWWHEDSRLKHHVDYVRLELNEAIKDETDILAHLPAYRSRIEQLTECNCARAIMASSRLLIDHRDQYVLTFKEVARSVVAELANRKSDALTNIRRLATFAFQHGKEDDDVWFPLNKDHSRQASDIFEDLIVLSEGGQREYQCTFGVIGSTSEVQSVVHRHEHFTNVGRDTLPKEYLDTLPIGSNVLVVQTTVNEKSVRNAVSVARQKLDVFTGLVSLYKNPPSLYVHPNALVEVNGQRSVFIQFEQAFRRLHPQTKARQYVHEAVDLLDNHKVERRVSAAIELLSLASSSADTRIRLINLWSSIETLAGAHESETTLDRVYALLVPLVIARHVSRATRYLAIQLQLFGDSIKNHDYGVGFPKPHPKDTFVQLPHLLSTLAAPENSDSICQLLCFAKHPLLRFRLYRCWDTYHAPKNLKKMLLKSKQRLMWHIARIYRARNRLVHHGEESPFIVPLLDNLQNYLAMTVQRLIHELKEHPEWDVRTVVQYWNARESHILRQLERTPAILCISDFLETTTPTLLWPPTS